MKKILFLTILISLSNHTSATSPVKEPNTSIAEDPTSRVPDIVDVDRELEDLLENLERRFGDLLEDIRG